MDSTIVLLHGYTHTGASWNPVLAALPERYRALAPDIRGHGASAELRPLTLEAVIDDIDRLTQGPFTLAGYSMGGRIALHVALALAGHVERLCLIGASPGIDDARQRTARREADDRLADEIERADIAQFVASWEANPVLAGQPPAVAAAARADRLRNTPAGLGAALRALGTGALPPVWDRLAELAMPVTLIVGERDAKFVATARRMAQAIADARVEVLAGAGHAVHLEAPGRVAALLGGSVPGQQAVAQPEPARHLDGAVDDG